MHLLPHLTWPEGQPLGAAQQQGRACTQMRIMLRRSHWILQKAGSGRATAWKWSPIVCMVHQTKPLNAMQPAAQHCSPQLPPSALQDVPAPHCVPTVALVLQHWEEVMHVLPQDSLPVGQAACRYGSSRELAGGGGLWQQAWQTLRSGLAGRGAEKASGRHPTHRKARRPSCTPQGRCTAGRQLCWYGSTGTNC